MEIREMSNEYLMRFLIVEKRQIKTHQSTIKQIEEELNKRFDSGTLAEEEEENG